MNNKIWILVMVISFVIVASCAKKAKQNKNAKVDFDGAVVIDVRTQGEYNQGHLKDAVLIPYDVIKGRINEYVKDKNQKIVVYCRSGRRSPGGRRGRRARRPGGVRRGRRAPRRSAARRVGRRQSRPLPWFGGSVRPARRPRAKARRPPPPETIRQKPSFSRVSAREPRYDRVAPGPCGPGS